MSAYTIRRDARRWVRSQRRDTSVLYRGQVLQEAQSIAQSSPEQLNTVAVEFLSASASDQQRRSRRLIGTLAVALVTLISLAMVAWSQRNDAVFQAGVRAAAEATAVAEANVRATAEANAVARQKEAEEQRNIAVSRQLATQAELLHTTTGALVPSVHLAVESLLRHPNTEASLFLQRTLDGLSPPVARLQIDGEIVEGAVSDDGDKLALVTSDHVVHIWNWRAGREMLHLSEADKVKELAFSHDGSVLRTSTQAHIRWWDTTTGQIVATVQPESTDAVTFSDDWRWAAWVTGTQWDTVVVWDRLAQQEVVRVAQSGTVQTMVFSPDNRWLAVGDRGATAHTWEVATGQETGRASHPGGENIVWRVTFSPDSKLVASSGGQGLLLVWEAATGKEVFRREYQIGSVSPDAYFSPDGRYLVVQAGSGPAMPLGSRPQAVPNEFEVWRVAGWSQISVARAPGRLVDFPHLAQAKIPYAASRGTSSIGIWNMFDGRMLTQFDVAPDIDQFRWDPSEYPAWVAITPAWRQCALEQCINALQVRSATDGRSLTQLWTDSLGNPSYCISNNGQYAMGWSYNGYTAKIWKLDPKERVALTPSGLVPGIPSINSIAFSSTGTWLAASEQGSDIKRWKMPDEEGVRMGLWQASDRIEYGAIAIAFSTDGRWLAAGGNDAKSSVKVFDIASGKEVAHMDITAETSTIAFSHDGKWIASGSKDGTARVWEAATGREVARVKHEDEVLHVAFSPTADRVVSGSHDHTARVWDAATGRELARTTHGDLVDDVSFSPDGRLVLSASWDKQARLWDAETGVELARFSSSDLLYIAKFSPDGRLAVTAGNEAVVRVWDVPSGRLRVELHTLASARTVQFSPDGRSLLIVTMGNTTVWDVETGRMIAELWQPSPPPVLAAAFSPDGRRIAMAGGYNKMIRVVLWRTEDLIAEACARLPNNLSQGEWTVYLGSEPYRQTCSSFP